MNLNCKPGDMAIIIGCDNDGGKIHINKPVTIINLSDEWPEHWITAPELRSKITGEVIAWHDDHLRPIRPSSEQDEMLRLVGLPKKETA